MMFTTFAFTRNGHALGLCAPGENPLDTLRANPAMVGVTALTILLQIAVVYVPSLERFFRVVPLSAANSGTCVAPRLVIWAPWRARHAR
jgi:Ca2+-transporting ATPase